MSYQALKLNGSGYASIADGSQTGLDMGTSDFMIEGRLKSSSSVASVETIVDKRESTGLGWNFYLNTGGYVTGALQDATTQKAALSDIASNDGRWYHVVFVVDRSSTTGLKLFIDGSETSYTVQQDPTALGTIDTGADLGVGGRVAGESLKATATYDEIRIWNFGIDSLPADYATYIAWRALKQNIFSATSAYDGNSWAAYVTNNLKAYWKFTGDYTDETANNNDLTAGGSGNAFPGYSLRHPGQKMLLGV